MPLGPALRSLMTPELERRLSGVYRSIFVDLSAVSRTILPHISMNARVLDIGGGDGELINHMLKDRQDLTVDMVDIAPAVGKFVQPEYANRVRKYTQTPVEALPLENPGYDVALISDVMHHLPAAYRLNFLKAVRSRLRSNCCMLIKDIEPGHPTASLSLFCDMYISGDKGVSLVSSSELKSLCENLQPKSISEIGLLTENRPNYAIKVVF